MKFKGSKVVIIGTGNVGAVTAYTIVNQGLCEELVLIDVAVEKAEAEALDMAHSVYFMNKNISVRAGDYSECEDADIVVITASAPMDRSADNRLEMLAPTKAVMKSIVDSIMGSGFDGVLLVVSNPVDIMTYYAWKVSGLPANQVIGSGTALDTARLCFEISELFELDKKSVSCYIIGEHGDSEVVCWSTATVGGKKIEDVLKDNADRAHNETFEKLRDETAKVGFEIFHRKGNTSYGIAASVSSIIKSILFNENRILPVSVHLDGQYGLNDIYLSVPTILNHVGAKEIVEIKLTEEEQKNLENSAAILSSYYDALKD
ncbi:MAG: L-lactate dehydrogenase [Lachnospiraceae bacterium]|nr:L-lactate dehydrogenase [Lachnospiraceae bacterium]